MCINYGLNIIHFTKKKRSFPHYETPGAIENKWMFMERRGFELGVGGGRGQGMLLVYWIHKVSRAAGDRMPLNRRIPLLVSTFEYKRGEGKCSTVSFLNLSLSPSLPPKSGWPRIKGYPAREVSLSSFLPQHRWSGIRDCSFYRKLGPGAVGTVNLTPT